MVGDPCLRCGGSTYFDKEEEDYKCFACGRLQKPLMVEDKKNRIQRIKGKSRYYEENKEAIIEAYHQYGEKARENWNIPKSTWVNLKKRWGLPIRRHEGVRFRRVTAVKDKVEKAPEVNRRASTKIEKLGSFNMIITAEDLRLLSDTEFNEVWGILGKLLRKKGMRHL